MSLADVDGCTVCKDAFKVEDKLRKLPCKHLFHENCIIPWLKLVSTHITHCSQYNCMRMIGMALVKFDFIPIHADLNSTILYPN